MLSGYFPVFVLGKSRREMYTCANFDNFYAILIINEIIADA